MEKPKISIGIPAYGAEKRIQQLLRSLLSQRVTNYAFHELIVHIDEYADATRKQVEAFSDSRIKIIETHPRAGYAHAMKRLFQECAGDLLITFNDDIKINDDTVLEKLVAPFIANSMVGIVTGRPLAFPGNTFIEKAVASADRIYSVAKYEAGSCNTANTTDGKAMGFSRSFIEQFSFPPNLATMGCVDSYLYFSARRLGFEYSHVKDAVVYGRNSATVTDYIKFHSRVFAHTILMSKTFPEIVAAEKNVLSRRTIIRETIKEGFRNPFGLAAIFLLNRFSKRQARVESEQFDQTWEAVSTSKNF